MANADDLTLLVGKRELSGWTSIQVSRSIERFPSSFQLQMTELYPGELPRLVVPGDACKIMLDDDLILTGYVDGYRPSLSRGGNISYLYGRNKCCDLVDAAAEWPGRQLSSQTVLGIAKALAFNYGIDVEGGPEVGDPIPQYNLNWGDTTYNVIEQICRYRALLVYDTPEGKLRLSRAGFVRGSSSVAEGKNVQAAYIDYRVDQRFSEYQVITQSFDVFKDTGLYDQPPATAKDPGVRRYRRKFILSESASSDFNIAQRRADWEYRRRAGRSAQLSVTVDSWRDGEGNLWEPNTLVHLSLPSLRLVDKWWLIADVNYKRDIQSGTTCDLVIMPPEAFDVQPADPQQFADIRRAMAGTPLEVPSDPPDFVTPEGLTLKP